MTFALKIAWKYFRARRKSLARFTSIIAVVGIAAGVASLILAQALARGFSSEMQEKILGNTAHITIFQIDGAEIANWQSLKENLMKTENVRAVSPTTYESILISGTKNTSYAVLRLTENSLKDEESATKDEMNFPSTIEVSVGAELAEKAGLQIGGEADLIVPAPNNFVPRTVHVRVAETFRTGLYDYDSTWIRVSPGNFKRIYERADFAPTILNVSVTDVYSADQTAQKIREILSPDFKILDWQEANRPLFAALSLEKKAALAVILLIVFIAVLNITTTLALLVNERKLDIAVLRTCGAKTKNLLLVFLFEGAFLGLTGTICGVILGIIGCFAANYFRLISLPADVYSLSYVPLEFSYTDIVLTALAAFVLSLIAAIYPAWRAARLKPLENLRNV
jgi:lipoprotein-releasing system permease protein